MWLCGFDMVVSVQEVHLEIVMFPSELTVDARAVQAQRAAPVQAVLLLLADVLRPLRLHALRHLPTGTPVRR